MTPQPNALKRYLPFGRPNFGEREVAAAARVLRSGWIGMGQETLAFEHELAAFVGAPHAVAVNSCTSALHLALQVSGVGRGDEVIVPSLTWCSSANAALYVGARPVFCDIDPETLCLSPETVRSCVGPRTRAVVVVHYGGRAVDVVALRRALPTRIAIIEDAAHALGAAYPDGSPVGSSGNLVCFSFYPNKNLATAEGGAIALAKRAVADRLRCLRQHALPVNAWQRFTHPRSVLLGHSLVELGYKMNFTDLQAAIARVQLRRLPAFGRHRRRLAQRYLRGLRSLASGIRFQLGIEHAFHARHLMVIVLPEDSGCSRDDLLLALRERNIGAAIHYAPLHTMPLYRHGRRRLPATDRVASRILTLPISASMTIRDVDCVCAHLRNLLGSAATSRSP